MRKLSTWIASIYLYFASRWVKWFGWPGTHRPEMEVPDASSEEITHATDHDRAA